MHPAVLFLKPAPHTQENVRGPLRGASRGGVGGRGGTVQQIHGRDDQTGVSVIMRLVLDREVSLLLGVADRIGTREAVCRSPSLSRPLPLPLPLSLRPSLPLTHTLPPPPLAVSPCSLA